MCNLPKIGQTARRAFFAVGVVALLAAPSFAVTIVDTGFESPTYVANSALDGQGGWVKSASGSTATVKSSVGTSSSQGVEVSRAANDDAYWYVPSTAYPSGYPSFPGGYVDITWDMNVSQASTASNMYGPFFGVVASQDDGSSVKWFGALGVDGATGDLLYTGTGGALTPVGGTSGTVGFGEWHTYMVHLNFQTSQYSLYKDSVSLLTNLAFVDSGLTCFTDADIMATIGDGGGATATGKAYYDNFKVVDGPDPSTKKWDGAVNDGFGHYVWDVGVTANLTSSGASVTFANNDVVVFDDSATNTTVTIAAGGVLPGNPLIFANNAKSYVINGAGIGGAATLRLFGGGQLTLNNSNTYTGDTQVSNNSTLTLGTATALGAASAVKLQDTARLQFGAAMTGASAFANAIHFDAGSAGAGASPILDTQAYNIEASGVVHSDTTAIGFTKKGSGQLLLSNPNNNYTGTTKVFAGTLAVAKLSDAGINSSLGAPSMGYAAIQIGSLTTGATLRYVGTGDSTNRPINLAGTTGGATLDQSGSGTVTFTSDLSITNAGAKTLTLQGSTAGIGAFNGKIVDSTSGATSVVKAGTGVWTLNGANTYTGLTTVMAGTLELGSLAQTPVLSGGTGVDIQSGTLVLHNTTADIATMMATSYNNGNWNVGQFHNSTAGSTGLTLGWLDNGAGLVTIMATYAGDANLDGWVNLGDIDLWKANVGISFGASWAKADFNYDGQVNLGDLDAWKSYVGSTLASAGGFNNVTPVPEPGMLALLLPVAVWFGYAVARRRREARAVSSCL